MVTIPLTFVCPSVITISSKMSMSIARSDVMGEKVIKTASFVAVFTKSRYLQDAEKYCMELNSTGSFSDLFVPLLLFCMLFSK